MKEELKNVTVTDINGNVLASICVDDDEVIVRNGYVVYVNDEMVQRVD